MAGRGGKINGLHVRNRRSGLPFIYIYVSYRWQSTGWLKVSPTGAQCPTSPSISQTPCITCRSLKTNYNFSLIAHSSKTAVLIRHSLPQAKDDIVQSTYTFYITEITVDCDWHEVLLYDKSITKTLHKKSLPLIQSLPR